MKIHHYPPPPKPPLLAEDWHWILDMSLKFQSKGLYRSSPNFLDAGSEVFRKPAPGEKKFFTVLFNGHEKIASSKSVTWDAPCPLLKEMLSSSTLTPQEEP